MTVYLHDIPLDEAKARFEEALKREDLWRVLGQEVIPLDEEAVGRSSPSRSWRKFLRHIIIRQPWMGSLSEQNKQWRTTEPSGCVTCR